VRTRGSLWVASDQFATAEQPFGALGFSVVTDQALAIGVTAVPTPITDEGDDSFFLWAPFFADVRVGAATDTQWQTFTRLDFDSKAMRKVNDGRSVIVTLENASAADGLLFVIKFRMLVKLHS